MEPFGLGVGGGRLAAIGIVLTLKKGTRTFNF